MKITKSIMALFLMGAISGSAAGLYIVSGSDFRECNVKYALRTTEENQEINVMPFELWTISVYQGNENYNKPWSLKVDSVEHEYSGRQVLGVSDKYVEPQKTNGCVNIVPLTHQFKNPGLHTVKLYNPIDSIFNLYIQNDSNVEHVYVDWSNHKLNTQNIFDPSFFVRNCPYLKTVWFNPPKFNNRSDITFTGFSTITNLDSCVILNTQKYKIVNKDAYKYNYATNDVMFANATTIGSTSFSYSPRLRKASFPNLVSMSNLVFFITAQMIRDYPEGGLRVIGLGDTLKTLGDTIPSDARPFLAQSRLDTVEFWTDEPDWVQAWNNHDVMPYLFGTATKVNDNLAVLTPFTQPGKYYRTTDTSYPKPTKMIPRRRSELQ